MFWYTLIVSLKMFKISEELNQTTQVFKVECVNSDNIAAEDQNYQVALYRASSKNISLNSLDLFY